jgi:hypothetical protein
MVSLALVTPELEGNDVPPCERNEGFPASGSAYARASVPLKGRCSYGLASSCSGFLAGVARLSVL